MEQYRQCFQNKVLHENDVPIVSPASSVCKAQEQSLCHVDRSMNQGWVPNELLAQFDDVEMETDFCSMFSPENELDLIDRILSEAL